VQIEVKGLTTGREFDRQQIEGCYLRVGGDVLASIVAMVKEVSPAEPPTPTRPGLAGSPWTRIGIRGIIFHDCDRVTA